MRKIFMLLVCAVIMVAFVGIGICADTSQSKEKNMGVMDKMKKAYNDFRNRGQAKQAMPAVKKEPVKPKVVPQEPVEKEFTKEEMVADMKDDLETYEEILDAMPGFKIGKDKEGKMLHTYNGVKIEDMAEKDLQSLFKKVRQWAIKLNTERIQQQLETVREAQAVANAARGGPATPPTLPVPPQIPQVSPVPSTPSSVPSTPRAPTPPPTPPSTRR